jgi:prepilin-type N-terminal cleavage/methylation domain-containing protein
LYLQIAVGKSSQPALTSIMLRSSSRQGFTLIEMLTVMLIIGILAGIVLSVNSVVQSKAARARAEGEMKTISLACESYKVDNGTVPRDVTTTDVLDPKVDFVPTSAKYTAAGRSLYIALSGDTNANGTFEAGEGKNYAGEFFKPNVLGATKNAADGRITAVNYIKDPFDNPYGYSTAGAAAEEAYIALLKTSPVASHPEDSAGYNPTFDLWSTAGQTTTPAVGVDGKWLKNW